MPRMITGDIVRSLLDYDPVSGVLVWKSREGSDRGTHSWNAKHAGKRAGGSRGVYGYRGVKILGKVYMEHRVIWLFVNDEWPKIDIDHINGDSEDNRLENLRVATRTQNIQNQKCRMDNLAGLKGIQWRSDMKKYHVRITVNGIRRTVGWYVDPNEAHAAYCREAGVSFGEFARAA